MSHRNTLLQYPRAFVHLHLVLHSAFNSLKAFGAASCISVLVQFNLLACPKLSLVLTMDGALVLSSCCVLFFFRCVRLVCVWLCLSWPSCVCVCVWRFRSWLLLWRLLLFWLNQTSRGKTIKIHLYCFRILIYSSISDSHPHDRLCNKVTKNSSDEYEMI